MANDLTGGVIPVARIMVVDDEKPISELLKFNLEKEGHEVMVVTEGTRVLEAALRFNPDMILLDLMLPGIDGFEVCRILRKAQSLKDISIMMLTARDTEVDKVVGLELGADDYVTKPFSIREVLARVRVNTRRKVIIPREEEITIGDLVINPDTYRVTVRETVISLTAKEFELLKLLASRPGKVFTRDFLLDAVWGADYQSDTRTVDVHIRHLRQKIEDNPAEPWYIETVRGVGYRFRTKTTPNQYSN